MITQQELLKAAIKAHGMTRAEFAKHKKISLRRLNGWLLPNRSKGNFRRADPNFLKELESELLQGQGAEWRNLETPESLQSQQLVFAPFVGLAIRFPVIHCMIERGFQRRYKKDSGGERLVEYRSEIPIYYEKPLLHPGLYTLPSYGTESVDIIGLNAPILFNDEPLWIFVQHHRSGQAMEGFWNAVHIAASDCLPGSIELQSAQIDGQLFSMWALPAPAHHRKPLWIFRVAFLNSTSIGVVEDCWQRCIHGDGQVTEQLPPEPEDRWYEKLVDQETP